MPIVTLVVLFSLSLSKAALKQAQEICSNVGKTKMVQYHVVYEILVKIIRQNLKKS